jgi:hypothetical protein
VISRVIVKCSEHERLTGEYETVQNELKTAHEAIMNALGLSCRQAARPVVSLAQKKFEACRLALRLHERDHNCGALNASV